MLNLFKNMFIYYVMLDKLDYCINYFDCNIKIIW